MDWQMTAERMRFPAEIAATSLRSYMVLWTQGTRQTVFLELTVPWEKRMDEAHERKMAKYQQLVEECQQWGWRTWCFAIEVRCRGFAGQTLCQDLGSLRVVQTDHLCRRTWRLLWNSTETAKEGGLHLMMELDQHSHERFKRLSRSLQFTVEIGKNPSKSGSEETQDSQERTIIQKEPENDNITDMIKIAQTENINTSIADQNDHIDLEVILIPTLEI
ncbi:unnamed protein product [Mytilus coruscus]|uniref:Uncharacterized protein n=1 Tax=Mytilus coruscus TaxID=42192 RepID=A0A6J8ENG2_MYTCO|nr:unnamed protein product [Mytilus coruscus]